MSQGLERVDQVPEGVKLSQFTLRDDNHQHYHRRVEIDRSPLIVKLDWRASAKSPIRPIGVFRLDLRSLLEGGYIRLERAMDPREVRIRFYRAPDGFIYLQARNDSPRVRVARASS